MPRTKKAKETTEQVIEQVAEQVIEEVDDRLPIKIFGQNALNNNLDKFVKKSISIKEEFQLINNVVSNCFDGYTYRGEYRHIAFVTNILTSFCNVKYDDINEIYEFAHYNNENIFERVLEKINKSQLSNIMKSIDESIEFRKQSILAQLGKDYLTYDVIDNVNECILSVRTILDNVSKIVNNLGDTDLTEMFKTYGPALIDAVGKFDQEKAVEQTINIMQKNNEKPKKTTTRKKKDNILQLVPEKSGDEGEKTEE